MNDQQIIGLLIAITILLIWYSSYSSHIYNKCPRCHGIRCKCKFQDCFIAGLRQERSDPGHTALTVYRPPAKRIGYVPTK